MWPALLSLVEVRGDLGAEVDDLELRLDPCHKRLLFLRYTTSGSQIVD